MVADNKETSTKSGRMNGEIINDLKDIWNLFKDFLMIGFRN
jgi:hypothetical protein